VEDATATAEGADVAPEAAAEAAPEPADDALTPGIEVTSADEAEATEEP
jgi:hypothetical protein